MMVLGAWPLTPAPPAHEELPPVIAPRLLEMLVCPEKRMPLSVADAGLIDRLNAAQREGRLVNRGGNQVQSPLRAGLVREDGLLLYPIVDGIPIMLLDEAIPLAQL